MWVFTWLLDYVNFFSKSDEKTKDFIQEMKQEIQLNQNGEKETSSSDEEQ